MRAMRAQTVYSSQRQYMHTAPLMIDSSCYRGVRVVHFAADRLVDLGGDVATWSTWEVMWPGRGGACTGRRATISRRCEHKAIGAGVASVKGN